MKNILSIVMVLCAFLLTPVLAADPELAGNWIGQIDTNRGQMEIGLSLRVEKGALVGVLKTAHGDWPVTQVTQKDGVWTVSFRDGEARGQLTGRIENNTFAGEWKSPMVNGTFELARAKKKG